MLRTSVRKTIFYYRGYFNVKWPGEIVLPVFTIVLTAIVKRKPKSLITHVIGPFPREWNQHLNSRHANIMLHHSKLQINSVQEIWARIADVFGESQLPKRRRTPRLLHPTKITLMR